ncbi:uncharacterized protein LOC106667757 [Cimex lectularius]|uniref:CPR type cuticle protein n=1 Tax=Cimex lectularius TaxID=79782 RepID=A0A8I6RWB1_CIMLE|nr:uncharacterized protein LOC106667757 [Cimex lectularius]
MFKAIVLACAVLATVSAVVLPLGGAVVRVPSLDSAVVKSDRLGGNFAYSAVEGHAYAVVNPVVQHVQTPVAVSYNAHPVAVPAVARVAVPAVAPVAVHSTTVHHPSYLL